MQKLRPRPKRLVARNNRISRSLDRKQLNHSSILENMEEDYQHTPSVLVGADGITRCFWCMSEQLYIDYHDQEWGVPLIDDQLIYEKLCLEGFQAGLSWLIILRKRESFRKAFANFDPRKVARFSESHVEKLVQNPGIVRHRGKIEATIHNARCALDMIDEFGSMKNFILTYIPEKHVKIRRRSDIVASSPEAIAMSKAFRKRGWKFLGPTTCYAFMQSAGLVNDHFVECEAFQKVEKLQQSMFRF